MEFYLKIGATVFLASLGWIITHYFTSRRDMNNARRQRRIDALSVAYDIFIRLALDKGIPARENHEGKIEEYVREYEHAIVMIHLYGNKKEVQLANDMVNKITNERLYDADDLVNELRRDIREDLGIEQLDIKPVYSRQDIIDKRDKNLTSRSS